ncbi:hypothetical protein KIW84_035994 [Lathyrus oleraceus]|uniref:DUF659 domain-containing protein n=1 Tax=Pisum sativum TaxID=3888 RepID=A0A9D5B6F7_PEA|nr:hypothetical protein KIW84_035994 [Pisum sativum]
MLGEVHEDDDEASRLLDISRIQNGKRSAEEGRTMFVKTVNAYAYKKNGQKLFKLLDNSVEEIAKSNVVQLVIDNGSNYVLSGKHL